MFDFKTLTLGVAPTRRDLFPKPENARANKIPMMKRLREIFAGIENLKIVDIEDVNEEGLLTYPQDVEKTIQKFREAKVDAVFFPHANFGQEEAVAKVAKALNVPVLIWGPRDNVQAMGEPNRPTDAQCGMFATTRALTRYGVPFQYIENCWLDSPVLPEGIKHFVRVASAVKALRGLRVLQISTRPWQFLSVKYNESEILERFGIEVCPVESTDLIAAVHAVPEKWPDELNALLAEWKRDLTFVNDPDERVRTMACLEIGIQKTAEENGCTVVSSDCWRLYNNSLGVRPCFVYGDLSRRGLPTACENDLLGAVSQAILMGATRYETPPFLADITIRHPENDNAELLWHCGPFPYTLAKAGAKREVIGQHGAFELKGGPLTLCRFDGDHGVYRLFAEECHTTQGPWTDGNYLWMECEDWPKWEKKLMYGPYIHHIVGAHGRYKEVLRDACRMIDGLNFDEV